MEKTRKQRGPKERPAVRAKTVDLLSRSIHSRQELRRKLLQRSYSAEEAAEGVAFAQDHNFLNEDRDAEAAARSLVSRGYWGPAIRVRLSRRGFSRAAVEQAMEQIGHDGGASEVFERLLPSRIPSDDKGLHRLAAKLLRRGIPAGLVRKRLNRLASEVMDQIELEAAAAVEEETG